MTLPAGLLPSDLNIEIFADPSRFGKCFYIRKGISSQFRDFEDMFLDETIGIDRRKRLIEILYEECFLDKKAVKAMETMGVKRENMVEQYNYCNRGAFDSVPDISTSGKLTKEFFDCGRRGQCQGEGKVCKLTLNGIKITYRELQCLRYTVKGKDYKQIASEMGFRNTVPVNSLMSRLREKLGAGSKAALIIMSQQLGIF